MDPSKLYLRVGVDRPLPGLGAELLFSLGPHEKILLRDVRCIRGCEAANYHGIVDIEAMRGSSRQGENSGVSRWMTGIGDAREQPRSKLPDGGRTLSCYKTL
jgi:hypothetical protein